MDKGAWWVMVHGVPKSWTNRSGLYVCIYISPKYIGFPGGTSGKEKSESCTVVSDSLEPHGL